jgi:hypothetical protein
VKARDADDFVAASNPNEPKQLVWIDDAVGATHLDLQATLRLNSTFPHVQAAIRRGAKFVFTSRDYVYRNAKNFLKQSALPIMQESQVVIRVEQLSKDEREQILYNHLRLGTQTSQFRQAIKPYLVDVAAHSRFSPEIARRLGHPAFTKRLMLTRNALDAFVERPIAWLQEVIRTLDAGSRAAIALVFMRGGSLQSPIELGPEDRKALDLLGVSAGDVRKAIGPLEGSLLIRVQAQGSQWWRPKHPTVLDAFAGLVTEDRELLDIYLIGTPVAQLMGEIACGDARVGGVKVHVPPVRFDMICERIERFSSERRENRDKTNYFLGARCGKRFLALYLDRNPEFLSSLKLWSYLSSVSEVRAINALHRHQLLPEEERLRHLQSVRELAVETPDSDYLDRDIVSFITEQERPDILGYARQNLLPNLDRTIDVWRDNCDDNPEDYFSSLVSALKDYTKELDPNSAESGQIVDALQRIDRVIEELRGDEPPEDHDDDFFGGSRPTGHATVEHRSIFDDVDE